MRMPARQIASLFGAIVLLSALVAIDYATGDRLAFFVFYFIPVAIVAWTIGRVAAVAMSCAAAGAWLWVEAFSVRRGGITFFDFWDAAMWLVSFLLVGLALARIRTLLEREKKTNKELTDALTTIRRLSGILPMCTVCRRIRDDQQNWVALEKYITEHSEAQVSHGMCPRSYRKFYGDPDGT